MNIDFGLEGNLVISEVPNGALTTVTIPPSAIINSPVLPVAALTFPPVVLGALAVAMVPVGVLTVAEVPTSIAGAVVSVVPQASLQEVLPNFVVVINFPQVTMENGDMLVTEDGIQLE